MADFVDSTISGAVSGAVGAITASVAKDAFKSIQDIWHPIFGYYFDVKIQEIRENYLKNLKNFQEEIIHEVENISPENIREPNISIFGPALEASKFYMDEENIRIMFAKLVASSIDKTKNNKIHHSFVEIIKMLSPLDAKNLYYMHNTGDKTISTIIQKVKNLDGEIIKHKHIFLGNPEMQEQELIEPSIDNLLRLGLIYVSYDIHFLHAPEIYEKHEQNPLFLSLKEQHEKDKAYLQEFLPKINIPQISKLYDGINEERLQTATKQAELIINSDYQLKKGVVELTGLGRNLCKICLSKIS